MPAQWKARVEEGERFLPNRKFYMAPKTASARRDQENARQIMHRRRVRLLVLTGVAGLLQNSPNTPATRRKLPQNACFHQTLRCDTKRRIRRKSGSSPRAKNGSPKTRRITEIAECFLVFRAEGARFIFSAPRTGPNRGGQANKKRVRKNSENFYAKKNGPAKTAGRNAN